MFTCVNKWEKGEKNTQEFKEEVGWEEEGVGLFKIRLPASPVVLSYEKSKRMELIDRENTRQRNGHINKAFASEVS